MRKTALFILLLMVVANAENYVVINSLDGRDVLSGVYYANVKNYPVKFLPYPAGDADILATKVGGGHDILLIQSADRPVSTFVQQALERMNNTVTVYLSEDGGLTNLDLALRSGATDFIVVDSAYSDSALSVMPYASHSNSYVLLSNRGNVNDVKEIAAGGKTVMIYGYVDSSVSEALAELSPEVIGKGEDRYEDNAEITGMLMEKYNLSSVIMVEGTFLEEGMIDSKLPIMFCGRIVPDATYDFVKEKVRNDELKTVYLIGGTQITGAVRNMREQIRSELDAEGLNKTFAIWLRFAQVIPGQTGIVTLDSFPLPAYIPKLEISEVVYNTATGRIMVTIDNAGNGPAYYLTEIHIIVDGGEYEVLGDGEVLLLEQGDVAGREYDLDLAGIEEGDVTALVIVKYGSGKKTLEEYTDYVGGLLEIDYVDTSNVSAREARYDSSKEVLYLSMKNNKQETAYVSSSITLLIDGEPTILRGPYNELVEGSSIVVVEFPIALSGSDLAANDDVTVNLKYGGRPGFLAKESTEILELQKEGGLDLTVILIVLVVVLVLIAAYVMLTRKGKKR